MFAACFRNSVLGKLRDDCSLTWRKNRYWVLVGWGFLKSHTWRRNSGAQRRGLHNTHWCCIYGIYVPRAGFGSFLFQAEFTLETCFLHGFLSCECLSAQSDPRLLEWRFRMSVRTEPKQRWKVAARKTHHSAHRKRPWVSPTAQTLVLENPDSVYRRTGISVFTEARCPINPHRRLSRVGGSKEEGKTD